MLAFALALASVAPLAGGGVFERPFRLQDAQGWIAVEGMASPLVADFDGDGKSDLLVGQFRGGKLRIYRNVGTASAPRFEGFTWFKTGEQEGKVPVG
jgi:hypothetical protein